MAKSKAIKLKGKKATTEKTDNPFEPKGKCKKALCRLIAINEQMGVVKSQLEKAANALQDILENTPKTLKYIEVIPRDLVKYNRSEKLDKRRSMIETVERIEFGFNSLKFYIDFTLVASERDDQNNIKGSIIYGTSRTLCFLKCLFPNKQKDCERTVRCDGLEDKPLIQFSVNRHGMIKSSGKLEGEWWIEDKSKSDLVELHYRALDHTWKDALDWANEIILP
ncbi:MAG: hypothetical protein ABIF87_15605 [Pseudomonadota bacterium]